MHHSAGGDAPPAAVCLHHGSEIVTAGWDKALEDKKEDAEPNPYALTRGSDYYRR